MNKPILVGLTVASVTLVWNFVWNVLAVFSGFDIDLMNFIIIRFFETFTITVIAYWVLNFFATALIEKHHTLYRTVAVTLLVWLVEATPFITLQNTIYWLFVLTVSQLVWDWKREEKA